ncbi:hypothetical protein EV182_001124 [Spiromyces aspiralis]|uniref:Uncharacterized protein n=1 Tax=Spiromyces aspiralis TaxID=68401 RepID=A0ACC1HIN0_9FUNG|nr:hypothetical protein EV182_001124 [Spiromyces aspiralis]
MVHIPEDDANDEEYTEDIAEEEDDIDELLLQSDAEDEIVARTGIEAEPHSGHRMRSNDRDRRDALLQMRMRRQEREQRNLPAQLQNDQESSDDAVGRRSRRRDHAQGGEEDRRRVAYIDSDDDEVDASLHFMASMNNDSEDEDFTLHINDSQNRHRRQSRRQNRQRRQHHQQQRHFDRGPSDLHSLQSSRRSGDSSDRSIADETSEDDSNPGREASSHVTTRMSLRRHEQRDMNELRERSSEVDIEETSEATALSSRSVRTHRRHTASSDDSEDGARDIHVVVPQASDTRRTRRLRRGGGAGETGGGESDREFEVDSELLAAQEGEDMVGRASASRRAGRRQVLQTSSDGAAELSPGPLRIRVSTSHQAGHGAARGSRSSASAGRTRREGGADGSVSIDPAYEPTEWIMGTLPSLVPYRPQLGDIIAYFRRGHEEFWRETPLRDKLSINKLPYVANPGLPQVVVGRVSSIKYHVGPPTYCTLKVQVAQIPEDESVMMFDEDLWGYTRHYIEVQYHDCEGVPDFVILYSRFKAALERGLKRGEKVKVLFDEDQIYPAMITEIHSSRHNTHGAGAAMIAGLVLDDPWKSILVRWDEGTDEHSTVSPWEVLKRNESPYSIDNDAMEEDLRERLIEVIDDISYNVKSSEWFVDHVDFRYQYIDYLLNIAYPMCLSTIQTRLRNSFYRRVDAVTFDMRLIRDNAKKFNAPKSAVYIAAEELFNAYVSSVENLFERLGKQRQHRALASPTASRFVAHAPAVPSGSNTDPGMRRPARRAAAAVVRYADGGEAAGVFETEHEEMYAVGDEVGTGGTRKRSGRRRDFPETPSSQGTPSPTISTYSLRKRKRARTHKTDEATDAPMREGGTAAVMSSRRRSKRRRRDQRNPHESGDEEVDCLNNDDDDEGDSDDGSAYNSDLSE